MPSPTTSSPGSSPLGDVHLEGLTICDYQPAESEEALQMERDSPQGSAYRLSFRREAFHRRAEQFAVHRIRTARLEGRLAGIGAVAIKDVEIGGRPSKAVFLFDLRVKEEFRGLGIGKRLGEDLLDWARPRSELAYTYTMGDNRAARRVVLAFGADAGGYDYLVRPVCFTPETSSRLRPASMEEVHGELRRAHSFDFYSNPASEGRTRGHVASWLLCGSEGLCGASAWSLAGVLEEVVVSLPLPLRALRALVRSVPARVIRGFRLPEDGETLRSLYLFDFFAPSPLAAREFLRALSLEARERGVDWLYLPHMPGDPLIALARTDTPALVSPVLPYRMVARRSDGMELPWFSRLYVDPRDL